MANRLGGVRREIHPLLSVDRSNFAVQRATRSKRLGLMGNTSYFRRVSAFRVIKGDRDIARLAAMFRMQMQIESPGGASNMSRGRLTRRVANERKRKGKRTTHPAAVSQSRVR